MELPRIDDVDAIVSHSIAQILTPINIYFRSGLYLTSSKPKRSTSQPPVITITPLANSIID